MNKYIDKLIHLVKRPDGKISKKIRKYDLAGKSGNTGVILRLIFGAVIFLLTCLPFLRNGFGMALQIVAFLLCSYDVILEAVGSIMSKNIFVPKVMISLASILAICVGEAADALLFIIAYRAFEILEKFMLKRSERDVKRVLNLRSKDVKVYSEGKLVNTPAANVRVGDHYMVTPGDRIPLDGIVVNGNSEIDSEMLTGENVLRKVHKGSPVLSGSINVSGTLSVRVTADLENSIVTKRLNYVEGYENYDKKVNESLKYFSSVFTPIAAFVALFIGIVPPIFVGGFAEWLHRASVLIAMSCPMSVFVSSAITYFVGVGGAAANGVLFKNKEAIDNMAQTGCVLFDKNGTLSTGKFSVTSVEPERVTGKELIELASYAFANSDSSIARAIIANVENKPDTSKILNNYEETGKYCVVKLSDGRVVAAGSEAMMKMMMQPIPVTHKGDTVVYVCVGREYVGCIHMSDKFRSDAQTAVEELHGLSIGNIAMLSGESEESGKIIAKNLEIDNYVQAVSVQEKINALEQLVKDMPANEALVYVANGYDDTHIFEYADVGVSMNGLISPKAMEYSDVILVKSDLSRLSTAVKFAAWITKTVNNNAIVMTAVTAFTALLTILGKVSLWSSTVLLGIGAIASILCAARAYSLKEKSEK